MADGVDIDLYADDIEQDFKEDSEFNNSDNQVDLYDDVITTPSNDQCSNFDNNDQKSEGRKRHRSPSSENYEKRIALYIGNLTWWTTDTDIEKATTSVGVSDVLDVKFYENRANGQSKGFCTITLGSELSSKTLLEKLAKQEIHGQHPVVTHCNRQSLNNFEMLSRKPGHHSNAPYSGSTHMSGSPAMRHHGGLPPHHGMQSSGHGRGPRGPPFHPNNRPPNHFNHHNGNSRPPIGIPPSHHNRPPPPRGVGPPPPGLGGPPPSTHLPPPPGSVPPGQPQGPPPGPPPHGGPPPHVRPPGLGTSVPPPRGDWDRPPGMKFPGNFPPNQPPPGVPIAGPPLNRPPIGGPPPPGLPPPSVSQPPPAPHVNPAFFPQASQGPPPSQHPPSSDMYGRPPPQGMPIRNPYEFGSRNDRSEPIINEGEFEEIMSRNRTVSSSAIARAVSDASNGDYASAIETLVTAISLIKQSKVAGDQRCKILVSSLQDTLHGIESKSYGSRGARERRSRERERSRERSSRSRTEKPARRERERSHSHEREYRDRERRDSRERDRERYYEERDRDRYREREHRSRH